MEGKQHGSVQQNRFSVTATAMDWATTIAGIQRASHRADRETCAERERKVSRTDPVASDWIKPAGYEGFGLWEVAPAHATSIRFDAIT